MEDSRTSFSDSRLERELLYTDDSHKIRMRDSQIIEETRDTIISEYNEARRLKANTTDSTLSVDLPPTNDTAECNDEEEEKEVERLKNTIRDLDTGEVYVLGENDPSFKFDMIEISPEELASTTPIVGVTGQGTGGGNGEKGSQQDQLEGAYDGTMESGNGDTGSHNSTTTKGSATGTGKKSWWKRIVEYIYGTATKSDKSSDGGGNATTKPLKTPFTKLSSFKFKKVRTRVTIFGLYFRYLLSVLR